MRLLITRPRADAEPLAEKLAALGHATEILPLLDIVPREGVTVPDEPWQAICITSANGLANSTKLDGLKGIPVFCVGPQSAAAAQAKGFRKVTAQGGDVAGLSQWISTHLKPGDGPLLYLSGATTSGDLKGRLLRAGFNVTRLATYDALETQPTELAAAVTRCEGVLLYSPRTAALWVAQVEKASLQHHMRRMIHLCLSPAVAAKLPPDWLQQVATRPDESAMLALLDRP